MLKSLRNRLALAAGIAGLAWLLLAWAEPGRPRPAFHPDEAMAAIRELSSPAYEGRLTGSAGNRKAMAWVEARFRAMGLQPFAGSGAYQQPFTAYVPELQATPVLEVRGQGGFVKRYVHYVDFRECYWGCSRPGQAQGRGGVLASVNGLDGPVAPIVLFDNKDFEAFADAPLLAKGVQGALLPVKDSLIAVKPGGIYSQSLDEPRGLVKFLVKGSVMAELKRFVASGCAIRMQAAFSMRWVPTANVVGLLPAASGATDDVEVISCHIDHVGRALDGGYYPGALDNASGTGVMLALARALAEHRSRLTKACVFVAFNAEEEYLGGSAHLVARPPLLPSRIEVLNFDMVGSRREVPLELQSAVLSPREDRLDPIVAGMEGRLKRIADRMGLPVTFNRDAHDTDHVAFAARRIPAVSFVHDAEGDYHTVRDDLRNIDPARLGRVGQLALDYLAETTLQGPYRWLTRLLGMVALAAGLGALAVALALRLATRRRRFLELAGGIPEARVPLAADPRRPLLWGPAARIPAPVTLGVTVFTLALLAGAGAFSRSAALGSRDLARLAAAADRYQAVFSAPERMPRPFPSRENEAAARTIATRFEQLGLQPYRRNPADGQPNYFLESRAMIPVLGSAPVLQLLAADGSVRRSYARGADFRETTAGHGGGGRVEGAFRLVGSAYDTSAAGPAIVCVRKADYQPLDDRLFAKWGAKAVLVEGDPAAVPALDYSDEKSGQQLNEGTFLKFIVAPRVMDELASHPGAKLRAEWKVQFQWAYPKTVIGCIPGSETGEDNELILATPLDAPAAGPAQALPFFLALAEAMAEKRLRPKHAIVFMASNGTGAGQLGARGYLESPMAFDAPSRDSWMGEDPGDARGIVGDYLVEADKASGRYATGRHLVNLVGATGVRPTLYLGSRSSFFRLPGAGLAQDLQRLARGRLARVDAIPAGTFDHEVFAEHWNPALTLALPAAPAECAGILARFIGEDAVAPPLTPLQWTWLIAKALVLALAAAWIARRWLRAREARKPHAPDPFDAFLQRPAQPTAQPESAPQ